MRYLTSLTVLLLVASAEAVAPVTCWLRGEYSAGETRICYYDCNGSPYAHTLPFTQFCPFTIER